MIDIETYDRWRKAIVLIKIIGTAEDEVMAGRTISSDEAFNAAEEAIERSCDAGGSELSSK